jgi:di/tripeptidase
MVTIGSLAAEIQARLASLPAGLSGTIQLFERVSSAIDSASPKVKLFEDGVRSLGLAMQANQRLQDNTTDLQNDLNNGAISASRHASEIQRINIQQTEIEAITRRVYSSMSAEMQEVA